MKDIKLKQIDAVLFDLDGTVYYGSKIIPGANEAITYFKEHGKRVYFTTNNSTKTRQQIFERLTGMGVICELTEVLTSGYLAAQYAKKTGMKDIYVFGSEDLKAELRGAGVEVNESEDAENLLIGFNTSMTYDGLTAAIQVALHARTIIACNRERLFPGEGARLMPGCGAMTAPIEWCVNRQADLIIGKPNTYFVDYLSESYGYETGRILVVGDSYESDVRMAHAAGTKAILLNRTHHDDVMTLDTIGQIPQYFEGSNDL